MLIIKILTDPGLPTSVFILYKLNLIENSMHALDSALSPVLDRIQLDSALSRTLLNLG